jgi:uncharacterized membrane protein YsdA (DUF1294 family)
VSENDKKLFLLFLVFGPFGVAVLIYGAYELLRAETFQVIAAICYLLTFLVLVVIYFATLGANLVRFVGKKLATLHRPDQN